VSALWIQLPNTWLLLGARKLLLFCSHAGPSGATRFSAVGGHDHLSSFEGCCVSLSFWKRVCRPCTGSYAFRLPLGELPTILMIVSQDSALEIMGTLMRELRRAGGMTLTGTAQAAKIDKGHLSHVERGRDRPSRELVAFYEERFNADGQLWTLFIEAVAGTRPRQRSSQAAASRYPLPGDASTFVDDITPDAVIMPPGFQFEKIWRIQNSGSVPWAGRWLRRLGPPAGLGIPSSPVQVQIATTMPGQTVDISVPIRAHNQAGTAEVHWKMVDDDGYEFFPDRYPEGIFTTVIVRDGAPDPKIRRLG
jgi:transcriptional regulator with XRE-family HTH domain